MATRKTSRISKKNKGSRRPGFLANPNLWMGLALVLVGAGLFFFHRGRAPLGFGLLVLSFALLAVVYFDLLSFLTPQGASRKASPKARSGKKGPPLLRWVLGHGWDTAGLGLVALALVLGGIAQSLVIASPEMPGWKLWTFYVVAGLLFAAGLFLPGLAKQARSKGLTAGMGETAPLAPKVEWIAFGAIMVLAAFLRIYRLGSLPSGMFIDQGMEGWAALKILHEHVFPVWEFDVWQNPGLLLYQLADWFLLLTPFHKEPSQFTFYLFYATLSLATFPLVYWTFRQLGGVRLALTGLFILAVMHWNMNFSRNGFPTIEVPFYTFGTLAFLNYALAPKKDPRFLTRLSWVIGGLFLVGVLPFWSLALYSVLTPMRWFAIPAFLLLVLALTFVSYEFSRSKDRMSYLSALLAAVFFATGLYSYQAYKIVPILLLLLSAYELVFNWKSVKAAWRPLLGFSLLFLVLAFPYLKHAKDTWGMGSREGQLIVKAEAFWPNLHRTASMFHWHGDNMSRHNLQDYRMLDDVTGVLFFFGLVGAVVFLRRKAWFYGLIGILIMSVPCVLSIDAAHANRMLGTTPFIALLAALPLAALWNRLRAGVGAAVDWAFPILLVMPLYLMLVQNYDVYFNRMAKSIPSWREYAVEETSVGKIIAKNGEAYDYYLSPRFYNYYTISFMSYFHPRRVHSLTLPEGLISHEADQSRGLYFALEEGRTGLLDMLKYYYPGGQAEYLVDPSGANVEYFYRVPAEELAKVRGLKAQFDPPVNGKEEAQIPTFPAGLPAGPTRVRAKGNLYVAETGDFKWEVKGLKGTVKTGVRPKANGYTHLEKGFHPVTVDLQIPEGPSPSVVIQQVPAKGIPLTLDASYFSTLPAPRGLKGSYHRDMGLHDEPFLVQWDPVINFTNGNDFSAVPPYAIHWTGSIRAEESGKYQFNFKTQEQVEMRIDGKVWIARGAPHGAEGHLTKGTHALDIIYYKPVSSWSAVTFSWLPPGGKMEVVPTAAFGETP